MSNYDALKLRVDLLAQRVRAEKANPKDARADIAKLNAEIAAAADANPQFATLPLQLTALIPLLDAQQALAKAAKSQATEESKVAKEKLVAEAEKLATGTDWKSGSNRLRELLDEWKALPRLDRAADDALWHRFSTARTAYTRRRKSHFGELEGKQGDAKAVKERLATEAEKLADSTDWGVTAGRFRDLMDQWKRAGSAQRSADESLWKRFRAAQDTFFAAREADAKATDAEFSANAAVKEELLVEIEALLPIRDVAAAKAALRPLAERWEAAGKVPRERIKDLEGRFRKIEQAIKDAEDQVWRNSDPEKSARAGGMIAQLEAGIADLEAKLAKADEKKKADLEAQLESRRAFLETAKKAAADFS